jgi:hypothetical protein
MSMQPTAPTAALLKYRGVLTSLAAAIAWGLICGMFRAPFALVAVGGLAAAALGFWLERATLVTPETARRKDFYLILVAGFGFFAVLGVGIVSLGSLFARWWLPRL